MNTKKRYESSSEILCSGGSETCDLTLIGSMTREFRRINIDPFTPLSTQEYTIRELVEAVSNVRLTFCDTTTESLRVGLFGRRLLCDPRPGLRNIAYRLVRGLRRMDLRVFKEA